jgi:hypothetical protein
MKFEDTRLPRHPTVEKAFSELVRLDPDDKYTTRGLRIARLVAHHGVNKDPDAIAAGLLVPLAQDLGPFLGAKADLPGRVPEMLDAVFSLGKASMCGAATDSAYSALDPAVRTVVLASSIRMFDVTAEDIEQSFKQTGAKPDPEKIRDMLLPVKAFTDMVARHETEEPALVGKCRAAMQRIESFLDEAGIKLTPASAAPPPVKDAPPPVDRPKDPPRPPTP